MVGYSTLFRTDSHDPVCIGASAAYLVSYYTEEPCRASEETGSDGRVRPGARNVGSIQAMAPGYLVGRGDQYERARAEVPWPSGLSLACGERRT